MHRIDSNGAVNGQWQAGNPAIGQRATQIPADWMNAIQEEVCSVVEGAGIDLDKSATGQLYDAIIALIAGVVGDGSGAVPTIRQILTSGLATGGGDLAANRTINVPKATPSEAAAGTDDTKAVTPYAISGLLGVTTIGSSRVIKIGPCAIQLFNGTAQGNSNTILTLPQAFSEFCFAVCTGGSLDSDAQDNGPWVSGTGLTTVSIYSSIDAARAVSVVAIGK